MASLHQIIIVGASLAGIAAAEALREFGYDGELLIVGAEAEHPYDRPPLSKEVLRGDKESSDIALHPRLFYDDLGIDLRLGVRAEGVNFDTRHLSMGGGENIPFDGLIIATGAQPRQLPQAGEQEGIHYLRTRSDCLRLKAALSGCSKLAVIGAGFIGSEVASSAQKLGVDVTIIDKLEIPYAMTLGERVGRYCVELHRQHGAQVLTGRDLSGIEGSRAVSGVRLSDGAVVPADVVVVGIGVAPATAWLERSGLTLKDGIRCDACCWTGIPGVFAAGDVASWDNPLFGRRMRVEHWSNAKEQGRLAARNVLVGDGVMTPYDPVPYFWSDQYNTRLQCSGYVPGSNECRIVHQDDTHGRLVAIYRRDERVVAVTALNSPLHLARYRNLIGNRGSWTEALDLAGSLV